MEEKAPPKGPRSRAKQPRSSGVRQSGGGVCGTAQDEASAAFSARSSAAFVPSSGARLRNYGRLKSFSSRHRLPMATTMKSNLAAASTSVKRSVNSVWTYSRSADGSANLLVDLSGETQQLRRSQEDAQEEEMKENTGSSGATLQTSQQGDTIDCVQGSVERNIASPMAGKRPRQPQRLRCLKLKCTAHPDLVMPYLYGDRKSRINVIMQETGCTIDYCPMSPGEEAQSPQSKAYIMEFLISAETTGNRPRDADVERNRSTAEQYNAEGSLYGGGYAQEYVKTETNGNSGSAGRESEGHPKLLRHPVPLVGYEVPVENEQQQQQRRQMNVPWREEFRYHGQPERVAGATIYYEEDIAYYDRWGRPVFRQEIDAEDFIRETTGDAGPQEVIDLSSQQDPARLLKRRRWQYLEDSEWFRRNQAYGHGAPHLGEDQETAGSEFNRPSKKVLRRGYAPSYFSGNFSDEEVEVQLREHGRPSMQFPRGPSSRVEDQYLESENEVFLNRKEDGHAEQDFTIKSQLNLHYASGRDYPHGPRTVRDVLASSYRPNRTSHPGPGTRHQYKYVQGESGEWLTDDEGLEVVYRRNPRYPVGLYHHPYVGFHPMNVSQRRRSSSYPSPNEYARQVRPRNPPGSTSKRQRAPSLVQTDGFMRQERVDIAPNGGVHVHSDSDRGSYAKAVGAVEAQRYDARESEIAVARGTEFAAHYGMPPTTVSGDSFQHINCMESEPVESERRGSQDDGSEPTQHGSEHDSLPPVDFSVDAANADAHDDEQMDDHFVEARGEQLEDREVAINFEERTSAVDSSFIEDKCEGTTFGESAADVLEHTVPDTAPREVPTCIPTECERTEEDKEMQTQPFALSQSSEDQPSTSLCSPRDSTSKTVEADDWQRSGNVAYVAQQPDLLNPKVVTNPRILVNQALMESLQYGSFVEAKRIEAHSVATLHQKKYAELDQSSKLLGQLAELCNTVHVLQCQIVSAGYKLRGTLKRQMLDALDAALRISSKPEMNTSGKIRVLRDGIDKALSFGKLDLDASASCGEPVECARVQSVKQPQDGSPRVEAYSDVSVEDNNWENSDGWFESTDDHYDMNGGFEDDDKFTSKMDQKIESSSDENEHLAIKKVEDVLLSPESPSFASTLFSEMSSCSPTSFVMKGMQKRLFAEISRANPYYYLHPVELLPAESTKERPSCDFGCLSGSVGKWTHKVISQISSRMKWFDEVTYSLAKSRSGGADSGTEILNRKKMNSTIRKLHLVAIQLHCLVSHLYCVRGRAECRENDSLPAALNNSYFEKRMTGYKSRLKLDIDPHGSPEDLLRDTFEFFPEFLLCIEMWGYDYREGVGANGHVSKLRTSSKALPLAFFGHVESAVFDYEQDKNGCLQTICEELLGIVCFWNDFVWGDNLDTLSLDRIITFESSVKKSVSKVLQMYSLHLMGSWANRLLEKPEELLSLRFTHQNAYYAESTKMRELVSSSQHAVKPAASDLESSDHCEDEDKELVTDYWNQKAEIFESDAMVYEDLPTYLNMDTIGNWEKGMTETYVLKWSRMFQIRGKLETYRAVLNDLVKGSAAHSSLESNQNESVQQLLQVLREARVVGRDLTGVSEKIALHSASCQLPQERKGNSVAPPAKDVSVDEVEAGTTDDNEGGHPSGATSQHDEEETSKILPRVDGERPGQPDLKDLVQILTSTRKEVEEIFCTRTRSARVRDKLQSQSIQLSQQTVDLFQNIISMNSD
ncbi:hypothetical protein FI667_g10768, partial [Globisporangium splendens]